MPTGSWLTTFREIRIVLKLSQTGNPVEIRWFIEGRLAESSTIDCDLESAKKTGIIVVDQRIPTDELWLQAEKRDREFELWRRCVQ